MESGKVNHCKEYHGAGLMTKRRMPYAEAREMMNGAARNQFCSYSKKRGARE
jgi:hypothetical protein